MLDFSSPLGGWTKVFEANKVALKECEMILPFFGDPMPPTTLPAAAWQLRARQDFIVEMITKSDGVMKYHRAIRSSHYTRDLDFEAFSKVWSVLGELSESDSANKKARVATADNLASSLRSGCSTPPCQSSNVR